MNKTPKEVPAESKKRKKTVRRIIKWTWIPLTCAVALFIGLLIGYVYLGKQNFNEVFHINTWRHMFDLVFSES